MFRKKNLDNKNLKNKDIKNKSEKLDKKEDSKAIPEGKVTNVKTYGSEKDYIVVELVGKYRNMWNYLKKHTHIQRIKKDKEDLEFIPIEYSLEDGKEFEFLLSQIEKIILDGIETEKTQENLLKFADRKGEEFTEALYELVSFNMVEMGKLKAKTMILGTLDRL